jgi:Leucine-rich repeat (LRR) protein
VYNVPDTEIAALQDLYEAANGDSWYGPGNKWNFTNPNPCADAWQGVNCSQVPTNGFLHVLGVNLYEYGLAGSIPPTLDQLSQLRILNLGDNALTRTIPDSVGQLTQLTELHLDENQLTGTIPVALGLLSQLSTLNLAFNQLSGIIPDSVRQLTQLMGLALNLNQLHGTIPDIFQQLTQLRLLFLAFNKLTGNIPASLGQLTHLKTLDLDTNVLSGTIPNLFPQLTQLTTLYLEYNQLSGTIPASLGQLSQLAVLDFDTNRLSGTFPDALQQLTQLAALYLHDNQLSGTIPAYVGQLTQLTVLDLDDNLLMGSIPDTLSHLAMLKVMYMQNNHLTGTISPYLGQLAQLRALSLGRNHLQGAIPQNWAAAANVQAFHLHENHLSGPIPESLGNMPLLLSLNLSINCLTGTIPVSLQNLSVLRVLMLQNNQLRGNIAELFHPSQANLSTVQLSGNQLTGTLPGMVFLLPNLTSFAAVDNCFEGPLPEGPICKSASLNVLVLDGLHSASCQHNESLYHRPFNLGTLPHCLLTLSNLTTLHLSGSGLTGSLPAGTNISAVLTDLSLSHNLLTGEVPGSILGRDWDKLDLSYNRFTGTLHNTRVAHYGNASHLSLKHNSLSGVIPASMQDVGSLSLLENNMFSCRVDRRDVPQQDLDSEKYTCGSDAVNVSLYAWLSASVVVVVVVGCVVFRSQAVQSIRDWFTAAVRVEAPKSWNVINAAQFLANLGAGAAVYGVAVLLPVYAVVNSYHPTFTYKYAWTVSGVFLTGTAAFALEAVFLLLQLPVCAYVAERWLLPTEQSLRSTAANDALTDATRRTLASTTVMLIGLVVVTGINVAFVIATLRLNGKELAVVQVVLAMFKLSFNDIAAPALQSRVGTLGVGHGVTTLQLLLVLLNVVVIPCFVVMFISPACFNDALTRTDRVTSSFKYGRSCLDFYFSVDKDTGKVSVLCSDQVIALGTTTYTPPFTYSYQCSSSFVTYYAPTFVIMSIISGFVVPACRLVLLCLHSKLSPASRLYTIVTATTPRILRELPLQRDLAHARSDPLYRPVFDAKKLVMSLLTYLALLLTFGALFPLLAVCCAVAMASVVLTARLEVGRYVSAALAADRQDCLDEVESACAGVATPQRLRMALYLVLAVSCLFYTLFLFDTLGYEVGFAGAFWVLVVVPLLPVVAWALYTAVVEARGGGPKTGVNETADDTDPEVGVELASMQTASGIIAEADEVTVDNAHGKTGTVSANPLHML